ncbi:hypothetical protein C900_04636 [Fulvivirga imtechensis AK7]|uniref:Uncharacterized protein n=1 Tax=Fulvivirga imtechensis AK7 TaxID=1237149 RepID=L8JQP3_9BACT|nr:hypothetical protein C900_04636 [Fulvivirga imtechensis AK7]
MGACSVIQVKIVIKAYLQRLVFEIKGSELKAIISPAYQELNSFLTFKKLFVS